MRAIPTVLVITIMMTMIMAMAMDMPTRVAAQQPHHDDIIYAWIQNKTTMNLYPVFADPRTGKITLFMGGEMDASVLPNSGAWNAKLNRFDFIATRYNQQKVNNTLLGQRAGFTFDSYPAVGPQGSKIVAIRIHPITGDTYAMTEQLRDSDTRRVVYPSSLCRFIGIDAQTSRCDAITSFNNEEFVSGAITVDDQGKFYVVTQANDTSKDLSLWTVDPVAQPPSVSSITFARDTKWTVSQHFTYRSICYDRSQGIIYKFQSQQPTQMGPTAAGATVIRSIHPTLGGDMFEDKVDGAMDHIACGTKQIFMTFESYHNYYMRLFDYTTKWSSPYMFAGSAAVIGYIPDHNLLSTL